MSTTTIPSAIPASRRSPLYTIFTEEDGSAGYLASKGWAAIGPKDRPNECGFLDPTKPDQDTYEEKDIHAPQWVEIGTDSKGQPIMKFEQRPLHVDEYGPSGLAGPKRTIQAKRVHFTAAVEPVNLQTALMIQRERDRVEQQAHFEAARAKAARK